MRNDTLRSSIVTGTLTLPFVAVVTLCTWAAADYGSSLLWGGLAIVGLLTYILMEWVNRNQLLRIRSRMVSSTFLALAAASPFVHAAAVTWVPPLCLVVAYILLLASFQQARPEGKVFYAFAVLTIGAFFFPPLIVLSLMFYASMLVQLRCFTWRTFMAGLFGVIVPVLFYTVWVLAQGDVFHAFDFVLPWLTWQRPDYAHLPLWQEINCGFLGFQIFLGLLHYYRTNFNDKIKVRMSYYLMMMVEIVLIAALCLYPDYFVWLYPLLLVNSAPLIGHYWALARGRALMTCWFVLHILLLIALALYNYGLLTFLPQ